MNLRKVSKYGVLFLLGLASWIPILVINIKYWIMFRFTSFVSFEEWWLDDEFRSGFYAIFVVTNYVLVHELIRRIEKWDVIDLLWKLLVIGISGISVTFLFQLAEDQMFEQNIFPLVKGLSESVSLYSVLIFCLSTIFIFRKLILYQKNRRKVWSWNILQGVFVLGLARLFIGLGSPVGPNTPQDINSSLFSWDTTGIYLTIVLPLFLGVSLFLSGNINWSAYLNYNQKIRSLGLLFVIILLFVAFYFMYPFHAFPDTDNAFILLTRKHLIYGMLFLFPFIYALLSAVVMIFNLQTSSVFEQRSIELATIQRINQSIQANLDTDEILRTLLDASLLTSNSTAGWIETIETVDGVRKRTLSYSKGVTKEEIEYLRNREDLTEAVLESGKHMHIRNLRKHRNFRYAKTRIRSLLALPIQTSKHPVGVVYLVNELSGSFEEASILSLVSLTEQSGISIENAELVARSIDLEIYREQLKIAKTFQKQILPQALPGTDKIEFFVKSQEVDEIGGDFYDVTQRGNTYKIAVGDVSGKGTTAAFYMAETKGIFQALTQLDIGVRDFILNANKALSHCFRKGTFMTLTYVHIHIDLMEVELLRAGHCQTLYYNSEEDKLCSLENGGLGLAMVRNASYAKYIPEPDRFPVKPGDLLILFTDGIIEAHNFDREEFGIDRLKEIVFRLRNTDSRLIAETLVQQVKAFTGGVIDDDYSILVIRFLQGEQISINTVNINDGNQGK